MPTRIRQLSKDTIARISAGEVVQRPRDIIKELIENSIDAGASSIEVEVFKAGRDYIRVSDNGKGMTKADLEIAFHRYTTSKINQIEDLSSLNSLGFRGEALASIGVVSRVICRSRTLKEQTGWELRLDGEKKEINEISTTPGTTLIVTDLFHSTPARRKFLKSNATEFGHIRSIITSYILAYPEITFNLNHEGNQVLLSPSSKKKLDSIIDVYGVEVGKAMVSIGYSSEGRHVHGFVSNPSTLRPTRDMQTVLINKRPIKSRTINAAIDDAYRPTLARRYPIVVLSLELPSKEIDVNVHPAKLEVHFSDEVKVYRLVYDGISEGLRKAAIIPFVSQKTVERSLEDFKIISKSTPSSKEMQEIKHSQTLPTLKQELLQAEPSTDAAIVLPQRIKILGQFKTTYIVAMDNESIILVDQHAAHERIVLDELTHKKKRIFLKTQRLLDPFQFELDEIEEETLRENLLSLKRAGFTLSQIGKKKWKLETLPSVCGHTLSKEAFEDILSDMVQHRIPENREAEELAHLVACHSAIRAGQPLSHTQMEILIRDLLASERPFICCHGRPTMIRLTESQLEREFGRVVN